MSEFMLESGAEMDWKKIAENALIEAYVLEAEILTRGEALKLALERDTVAARGLAESVTSHVRLDQARKHVVDASKNNTPRVNQILTELGF